MNTSPQLPPPPKRYPVLKYFLWSVSFAVVAALAFAGTLMAVGAPIWDAHQAGALNELWLEKNVPQLLSSVWVTIGAVITILASVAFVVLGIMFLWNLGAALFSGSGNSGR
ncbi:MAG: hypothetical protein ACO1QR_05420 [Chthoniobacteraceae bacterium]